METFAKHMGVNVIRVNAEERFLDALKGETDPERKRKIIGRLFVEVFEEEAAKLPGIRWLAQGTIYPDVIESAGREDRQGARHQEPSQRRRPAGEDESEAARAAARAVQGRSAQARRRARPAARDGVSPSVPGPGPGRAHPRRSDEAIRGPAAQGRRDLHRRAAQARSLRSHEPGVRRVPAGALGRRDGRRASLRLRDRAALRSRRSTS